MQREKRCKSDFLQRNAVSNKILWRQRRHISVCHILLHRRISNPIFYHLYWRHIFDQSLIICSRTLIKTNQLCKKVNMKQGTFSMYIKPYVHLINRCKNIRFFVSETRSLPFNACEIVWISWLWYNYHCLSAWKHYVQYYGFLYYNSKQRSRSCLVYIDLNSLHVMKSPKWDKTSNW